MIRGYSYENKMETEGEGKAEISTNKWNEKLFKSELMQKGLFVDGIV